MQGGDLRLIRLAGAMEVEQVPPECCTQRRGEAFTSGVRRLPRYVKCPRIKTAEAVTIPEEGLLSPRSETHSQLQGAPSHGIAYRRAGAVWMWMRTFLQA